MLAQTHELLNLTLESGNHHSNHNFLDFFIRCISMLPTSWYLKRIRADRGFFDQDTLEYCEENGYEYVVKAKMQKGIQKIIDYVNENPKQYPWTPIRVNN
nr:transposase [Desulfitibacter alkalitolerans]